MAAENERWMKILTNEYLCNTPDFKQAAKGGPANFARLFFSFLKDKQKNNLEWQGLIIRDLDPINKGFYQKKLVDSRKNRSIFKFSFPFIYSEKLLKAKKVANYREILKEPIKRLSVLIAKIKPDAVFLNGFSLGNWLILEASRLNRIPVVIQHAGIWTKELEIYRDFYSPAGIKMMEKMEREAAEHSTAEIFLNSFSQRFFYRRVMAGRRPRAGHSVIIPLPIDFRFFRETKTANLSFDFRKEDFNIGMIARWDRIKNHEAVALLAKNAKDKNLPWSFHSVTRIPESQKNAKIKNIYRRNIEVVDFLPKDKIRDFCQSNDLIIIPSHFDVSPTVLLEALASGTPVAISPNVGFVDDYRRYGASDWIIDFENPEAAIRRLKKIKNKPLPVTLKRELFKKHDPEKVFKKYAAIFSSLIGE